MTDQIVITDN